MSVCYPKAKFKPSKPLRKTTNGQQATAEDEADEDGDNSDIDTPAKEWLLEQLSLFPFSPFPASDREVSLR